MPARRRHSLTRVASLLYSMEPVAAPSRTGPELSQPLTTAENRMERRPACNQVPREPDG
jgi:hypothetical protein